MSLSTLTRRVASIAPALKGRGVIGVDVGARVIKLAQVGRSGSGWNLAAARVVATAKGDTQPLPAALAAGLLAQSLKTASLPAHNFRGKRSALVLASDVAGTRTVSIARSGGSQLRTLIAGELRESAGCEMEFDYWNARTSTSSPEGMSVDVCGVPTEVAMCCWEQMRGCGLECQFLNGLPFALASAVSMADSESRAVPVACLDWGHHCPTITVCRGGRPLYSRTVRNCGVSEVERGLCETLNISPLDAARLFTHSGVADSGRTGTGGAAAPLRRIIEDACQTLIEELQRTLEFLRRQMPDCEPKRLWLTGGGGTIRGIAAFLESRLNIETVAWTLSGQHAGTTSQTIHEPLFAAAAGLSRAGVSR